VKILLSGMIAGDPHQGGASWAVLQYVLGLRRLGHDVTFVEPVQAASIQPAGSRLAESVNARYFAAITEQFGLRGRAALLLADAHETVGLTYPDLVAAASASDVLINISGMLTDPELLGPIRTRVYLDLDPAFNQLWHAVEGIDMRFAGHTHFLTVGQAIGQDGCTVPTCGRQWMPTLQPVVLEHWTRGAAVTVDALTTVANWRGYGSVTHQGVFYGQKAHALRPLLSLPRRTTERFVLALTIHPEEVRDLEALNREGWELLDASEVAGTPDAYRRFIQGSKAELGIAKGGYVASRCGWFSDRSACYLASGRPVIVQDTGFSRFLPTGEGLLPFDTADSALDAIARLNSDYHRHASAARTLAEECFDSDKVLKRLLANVGATE
jgi:hypothetical protein